MSSVGLLGTRYTMEQDFHRGRLSDRHGLEVLVPDEEDRNAVHHMIYDELVQGRIEERSRAAHREVMANLVQRGAEGIILGCTEIGLLVHDGDPRVPPFDTTRTRAERVVELALTLCIGDDVGPASPRAALSERRGRRARPPIQLGAMRRPVAPDAATAPQGAQPAGERRPHICELGHGVDAVQLLGSVSRS